MSRVLVLLSTFNGASHLRDQIDSILQQTETDIRLIVRDDGSSDESRVIVEDYVACSDKVEFRIGKHLGPVQSFLTLLQDAEPAEFFAFSDQDDVWNGDRLERAIAKLRRVRPATPALYCSRVEYVDAGLTHLGYSPLPSTVGFPNALVQNVVPGCTIVMNRAARQLVCGYIPEHAIMHDWWCYLVISALGAVIYDDTPSLKYRIHWSNTVGAGTNRYATSKRRATRVLRGGIRSFTPHEQACEFGAHYGASLCPPMLDLLTNFVRSKDSLKMRLEYATRMKVRRQSSWETGLLRALIAIGYY